MKSPAVARSILIALGIAMASSVIAAQTPDLFGRSSSPLEGSWEVLLKPKNCVTGVEVPPPWNPAYQTFNAGGTMLEMTSAARFLPGQRAPGHGHWERTDVNAHEAAFQAFILFDGDPNAVPPNPYRRGHVRIEQKIEFVDADHWHSDARTFFRDVNGNLYMQGCANGTATRML